MIFSTTVISLEITVRDPTLVSLEKEGRACLALSLVIPELQYIPGEWRDSVNHSSKNL